MERMRGMEGGMGTKDTQHHHQTPPMTVMHHMTFFWGKNAEILFSGWPGTRTAMYVLALIFVFVTCFLVEWISHSRLIKGGSNDNVISAALVQTAMHAIRVGLAYLVMLALMSFNGGVFLVAVLGHALGFFIFGSRVSKKTDEEYEKPSDLPPLNC